MRYYYKMNLPIGHDSIASQLRQLHDSGKLPHSFLFYGPKGVGKSTMAQVFGRFLLCGPKKEEAATALFEDQTPRSFPLDYNQSHEVLPQIEAGSTPDFHIISPVEGKQSISAEQARGVIEKLSLSSDRRRVVIIDGAELMTTAAANVVLKTLEEPRPNIHFILVSHGIAKLLPTIISRCRQFRFKPLSQEQVGQVLKSQNIKISEKELTFSAGCPGHAIMLTTEGQQAVTIVEKILKNKEIISTDADLLGKKENFTVAMNYLLQNLYNQAIQNKNNNKYNILYKKVDKIYKESKEFNLSGHLAITNAFTPVLKGLEEEVK